MQKIAVKEYARLNRISVYEVIKRIQRGDLQGVTLEENGMRVRYVVLDEASEGKPQERTEPITLPAEGEKTESLKEEIEELKREVRALRQLVETRCLKSQE